ncbi:2277_t:CDS:2, partial [Acaulospora colombiana]
ELGNYFQVINIKDNVLVNFNKLLDIVDLSDNKLYVCTDEYDASMNEALKNETLLQPLTTHHYSSVQSIVKKIESLFKQFYRCLKYACDEEFNISEDLALSKKFWDLYSLRDQKLSFSWIKLLEIVW